MTWRKTKKQHSFIGEVTLVHVRYGTFLAKNSIESDILVLRAESIGLHSVDTCIVAGNFNNDMFKELFRTSLIQIGQHPKKKADTGNGNGKNWAISDECRKANKLL